MSRVCVFHLLPRLYSTGIHVARCLVLASDGVWDVMSNDQVCTLCSRNSGDAMAAAKAVRDAAVQRWTEKAKGEFRDDVSVVVVFLPLQFGTAGSPQVATPLPSTALPTNAAQRHG